LTNVSVSSSRVSSVVTFRKYRPFKGGRFHFVVFANVFSDVAAALAAIYISHLLLSFFSGSATVEFPAVAVFACAGLSLPYVAISAVVGLYDWPQLARRTLFNGTVVLNWLLVIFPFAAVSWEVGNADVLRFLGLLVLIAPLLTLLMRAAAFAVLRSTSPQFARSIYPVLLVSDLGHDADRELVASLDARGQHVVIHVALTAEDLATDARLQGLISKALASSRGNLIEGIALALSGEAFSKLSLIIARFQLCPHRVDLLLPSGAAPHSTAFSSTARIVHVKSRSIEIGGAEAKRAFDILFAGTALLFLGPLMLLIAMLVRMDGGGPALFRQQRTGFNGQVFRILKFRTMTVMEDGDTVCQASKNDARVTRIGRFLRSSSLDELPQLLNVLRGHMSIVGPRPHALAHDRYYSDLIENYGVRQNVRPGLTGWAQVNGSRGPTPKTEDMAERVNYDTWYVGNWSFWLDLKIVFRTVRIVLSRRSAF
jgi:exopolysaccharide biosynthesis polyprenyl glycosylphosphotransferase